MDGLPADFPPLRTLYRSNLPTPATPFLGRETELATVVALLTRPDTRLLTLTGPGGTGKTRLALQAAAEAADHYPDGLFWVPLASVVNPALMLATVAQALNVKEQPNESLVATLARSLHGRKVALLLDNVEQLLPQAAGEVAAIIADCPTVKLLVTSRERLRIQVETSWAVPPMSEADGERLFLERARQAGVELQVDDVVGELCRRLDEMPLALELAAARTVVFSAEQLLERLGQRLDLLKGGPDLDPRQQTLRATIEWSYHLLDSEEQRVYRALGIFLGGCHYDAAEKVADADPDLLQSLLDKSLLRREDTERVPRYWMLETVRQHAVGELRDAGEDESVFDAFLGWISGIVGEVNEYWVDRDQLEWFDTLERERANLMHAAAECRARRAQCRRGHALRRGIPVLRHTGPVRRDRRPAPRRARER